MQRELMISSMSLFSKFHVAPLRSLRARRWSLWPADVSEKNATKLICIPSLRRPPSLTRPQSPSRSGHVWSSNRSQEAWFQSSAQKQTSTFELLSKSHPPYGEDVPIQKKRLFNQESTSTCKDSQTTQIISSFRAGPRGLWTNASVH